MPFLAAPGDPPGPVSVTLQVPGAVPANAGAPPARGPGQVTGNGVTDTARPVAATPVVGSPPRAVNSLSPSAPLAYTGAPLAMEGSAALGLLVVGTLSVLAARRSRRRQARA